MKAAVSDFNETGGFAIVRRPPNSLEKANPGAKRIRTEMVAETLALLKSKPAKPTLTVLRSSCLFGGALEMGTKFVLAEEYDLKFIEFATDGELLQLVREHGFDLIIGHVGNISWYHPIDAFWVKASGLADGANSRFKFVSRAIGVLASLKAEYGKPIIMTQGLDLAEEFGRVGIGFLTAPFNLEDYGKILRDSLNTSHKVERKESPAKQSTDVQKDQSAKPIFALLLMKNPACAGITALSLAWTTVMQLLLKDRYEVRTTYFETEADLLELANLPFDLINLNYPEDDALENCRPDDIPLSGDAFCPIELKLLERLERHTRKPIIASQGLNPAEAFKKAGVIFVIPPTLEQFQSVVENYLNAREAEEKTSETTFRNSLETSLKIPCVDKSQAAGPVKRSRLKIVILDDEEGLRRAYSIRLKAWYNDVEIKAFANSEETWGELSNADPDLFITDITHPGLSCGDMLTRLAARKVKFPILLISATLGSARLEQRYWGPDLRISFMAKTFSHQQFKALVEAALGKTRG